MATETLSRPLLQRVSWGAIFAGLFVGFALWFLLLSLGAGIGGAAFDPRSLSSWKGMGIGLGLWGVISAIISYFLAAWVTARLALTQEHLGGLLHGVALWGFMLVVGAWIAATAVMGAAGTAASAAGSAVGGLAKGAGSAASAGVQQGGGGALSAVTDQVTNGMNQWIQQQGMRPIPKRQMQQAISNIGQTAVGKIARGQSPQDAVDQQTVVAGLTQAGVSRAEAQQLSAQLQQQLSQALSQAGQGAQQAAGQAGEAAATAGTAAAWAFFVYALLTLIAAAIGGWIGATGERRTPLTREETVPVPPNRPLTPQRA